MKNIPDLGTLTGPLLAFGGPYGNLQATKALLAKASDLGISGRNIVCTGDLVAYCADPQATTDILRTSGATMIMGNCEESLGSDATDCGCGFEEGSTCAALSEQWFSRASRDIDRETKAWMAELPRHLVFTLNGRRFGVVHGTASTINQFVWPSSPPATKRTCLEALGVDAVISGHSGIPFAENLDEKFWINAGAIGMPANDGTPRTWYCLIEPTGGEILVAFHALDYDHGAAARTMRQRNYPEPYARALETGLWPSLDVLEDQERHQTGQALAPQSLIFPARRKVA